MIANAIDIIKELFSSNNPLKKVYDILSFILFSELVIILTNKLFPLYNIFLLIYPSGITQEIISILQITFYISFTLSTIYSISLWFFILLDSIWDKRKRNYNAVTKQYQKLCSTQNKLIMNAHGCELNLCVTNDILLIVIIPLSMLNESLIIDCWGNHPLLCILVGFMMLFSTPATFFGIINRFFSL